MAQPQSNNIKILSIVWYKVLPPKFGGQKAVALFNQHLGAIASLQCLCSKDNEAMRTSYTIKKELPVSKSQFLNPLIWRKIYSSTKKEKVTHLLLEFPYHGIAAFFCKKLLGIKLVVNTHNIEFLRFKEQKKWWWKLLFYYERWTLNVADMCFFKTKNDKQVAISIFKLPVHKTAVIPFGAEEKELSDKQACGLSIREKHSIKPDEKILLFAGTLDYKPNAEAVKCIDEIVVPLLLEKKFSFRVIACGRNKLREYDHLKNIKNANIIFAGEVIDMDTYFKAATIFINPVLTGGGVQTKTMDALSYHLNTVCFQQKLTGIEYASNKIFAVENGNWRGFAKSIIEATKINEPTGAGFFRAYNWDSIVSSAHKKIAAC